MNLSRCLHPRAEVDLGSPPLTIPSQLFPSFIPFFVSYLCAKCLVVVDHARSVSHLARSEVLHGELKTLGRDGDLLDPRLDAVVGSQLQHLEHLPSAAQVRRADVAAVGEEVLVAHGQAVAAGKTNRVPVAVDVEEAEVLAESEALERGGGVDDDVKGHLVALGPVLLACGQETVDTHLTGILLLCSRTGDGPDLGAEGLGKEKTIVAEAANTDDADLLSGASTEALQRAVYGDTGAEHRGGLRAGEGFGDRVHPVSVQVSR